MIVDLGWGHAVAALGPGKSSAPAPPFLDPFPTSSSGARRAWPAALPGVGCPAGFPVFRWPFLVLGDLARRVGGGQPHGSGVRPALAAAWAAAGACGAGMRRPALRMRLATCSAAVRATSGRTEV